MYQAAGVAGSRAIRLPPLKVGGAEALLDIALALAVAKACIVVSRYLIPFPHECGRVRFICSRTVLPMGVIVAPAGGGSITEFRADFVDLRGGICRVLQSECGDRLPTIAVDAKGATVREILTQLADRLHFQIENPQAVENSPTFSGSFTGDLTDVLRRVLLRDVNYAIMYRELAIERIVIVGSGTADAGGVKLSSSGNVAGADNVRPTDTATAETSWTRPPSPHPPQASQIRNSLARLLEAQANITEQTVRQSDSAGNTNSKGTATSSGSAVQSSSSTGTAQLSLAAMTQAAQTNVRMLAKALNSVCVGANCAQ
jgi:hypothetical protein